MPTSYEKRRARVKRAVSKLKARRESQVKAATTSNKAVNSTQRKPFVPKLVKNTNSIATLANQVRKLQLQRFGRVQTQIQGFKFPTATSSTWTTLHNYGQAPSAFCLNDFTDNARLYQVHKPRSDAAQDALETTNRLPWVRLTGLGKDGNINDLGMDKDSSYWNTVVDNEVSQEYYLPISSTIQLEVSRICKANDEAECCRIDIVSPKKHMPQTLFNQLILPNGLLGMANLANKNMLNRNKINRKYFNVVKTKYLYFKKNYGTDANSDNTTIRKYFKWNQRFPSKPIDLDTNAYQQENQRGTRYAVGDTLPDGTTSTSIQYLPAEGVPGSKAAFLDIIEPEKQYWMILSFSQDDENDSNWAWSMLRTNKWRDPHGID